MAIAAGRERGISSGERSSIGRKDVPTIRQHQDIAPHLAEEDLAQRDAVTVVPPIAVKHEHRRPRCRKLQLVHISRSVYTREGEREIP